MPYLFEERVGGSYISQGECATSKTVFDSATQYEGVYSFRSGQRSNLSSPSPDQPLSLSQKLDLRRNALSSAIDLYNGGHRGSPTHFLTEDIGHEFGVFKSKMFLPNNELQYQLRAAQGGLWTLKGLTVRDMFRFSDGDLSFGTIAPFADVHGNFFRTRGSRILDPVSTGPTNTIPIEGVSAGQLAQMNPFKSKASFLTTALELFKGDVPGILSNLRKHYAEISFLKTKYRTWKDASSALGGDYLNSVFGWAPVIRDVQAGLNLLIAMDSALFDSTDTRRRRKSPLWRYNVSKTEYREFDPGPVSRKGAGLDASVYKTQTINSFSVGPIAVPSLGSRSLRATFSGTYDVYTTARFNNGVRPTAANNGYIDRASELLGLRLTPEVLWDLAPWSWLVDWFVNIGSVLENLSTFGFDNTILNYAYATGRYKYTATIDADRPTLVAPGQIGVTSFKGSFASSYSFDSKVRLVASPFGFAASTESLSTAQWAILVALGLARQR